MNKLSAKKHWETIYGTKNARQVSWTQDVPQTSLDFIHSFGLDKSAKIIDVGGGDSKLVDCLLEKGFKNVTVLDISSNALNKAKKRLGDKAKTVNWIESDITKFRPSIQYDIWHDRATFHFLTEREEISKYLDTARQSVHHFMMIGTFSTSGPTSCSGLDIMQYNKQTLTSKLKKGFQKMKCITENHITPFGTAQNYLFCSFKRRRKD
jgi:ribosomal protein L11 methylase PrmA